MKGSGMVLNWCGCLEGKGKLEWLKLFFLCCIVEFSVGKDSFGGG